MGRPRPHSQRLLSAGANNRHVASGAREPREESGRNWSKRDLVTAFSFQFVHCAKIFIT